MTRPRAVPVDPASIDYLRTGCQVNLKPQTIRRQFTLRLLILLGNRNINSARPIVYKAWFALSQQEQEYYSLFVLEENSFGDIARWLDVSKHTVSNAVYRAQTKLEKTIRDL